MSWEKQHVTDAFRLFMQLLSGKEIPNDDREWYPLYQNLDVREILEEVFEREARVKVVSHDNGIGMVPEMDNNMFSYSNAELKRRLKLDHDRDLHLAYYAILILLASFHNNKDASANTREMLLVEEWMETIENRIQEIEAMEAERLEQVTGEVQLNLSGIREAWRERPLINERLKEYHRTSNNQTSFILNILRFLEQESLVRVFEETEITLTSKMKHIVRGYYFDSRRKEQLLDLLSTATNKEAVSNAQN